VAVDSARNMLYVSDSTSCVVYQVNMTSNAVTLVAGMYNF